VDFPKFGISAPPCSMCSKLLLPLSAFSLFPPFQASTALIAQVSKQLPPPCPSLPSSSAFHPPPPFLTLLTPYPWSFHQ